MPKKMCASIAGGVLGFSLMAAAAHADTYTVTTPADKGKGSLREALKLSNQSVLVPDVIVFKIPGDGPHTIELQSPLVITDAVTIDGYTQDGARPNTEPSGNNAVLQIVLDGFAAGAKADGLRISATGTKVRGLVIQGFDGDGITLGGIGGHVISGNFIGTDAVGQAGKHNVIGIRISPGSSDNTIGGATPEARNVISGNFLVGILISKGNRTSVEGNFIGTDKTGSAKLANRENGIFIEDSQATRIGGTSSGQRNVISGNGTGINCVGASETMILGNFIGTGVAGTDALGNRIGVALGKTQGTVVGQTTAGAGNIIAHNELPGVAIFDAESIGNAVRGNNIFKNGRLGIDLRGNGVTQNDPAPDADTGPNRLQNFPVLTKVEATAAGIKVSGALHSVPKTTFFIDFYSSEVRDPSGHGEGQFYLGSIEVTTDDQGVFAFQANLPAAGGPWISATATRKGEVTAETSEFSELLAVPGREFGVRNKNPDGPESFAQAVADSNAAGNPNAVNKIRFDIAGDAVISVFRPLVVRAPVYIDGYSQPGAIPNSDRTGFNGKVAIVLDGSAATTSPVMVVTGDSSTIEGLSFVNSQPPNRFGAVQVSGDGNWFGGNVFGLWPDGTPGPNRFGVTFFGDENRLGSYTGSEFSRNVLSSNQLAGAGVAGLGNVVANNLIGTDFTGTQDRGNGEWGVSTSETGENISITENVIAFNDFGGVELAASSSIVSQNSMFDNGGLAIDIPPAGVNPNVPGGSQNYPVLTFAFMGRRNITIGGTVDGPPKTPIVVEFFASPSCDPSGYGEGKTFLGWTRVRTDETGHAEFQRRVPRQGLQAPQEITAVAGVGLYAHIRGTRMSSPHSANTSEFAACLLAQ